MYKQRATVVEATCSFENFRFTMAMKVFALALLLVGTSAGTTPEGKAWLSEKGSEDGVVTLP
jgi:hypothetical protein